MDIVDKLGKELLMQPFAAPCAPQERELLDRYRQLTAAYAHIENAIAVLSDMRTSVSYIYYGGVAETLGMASRGTCHEVHTVWEKEIFDRIHPDDLSDKYLQELRFFQFLKHQPKRRRTDFYLRSVLRMRDKQGSFRRMLHRLYYVSEQPGVLQYALCLYNAAVDEPSACVAVDSLSGQTVVLGETQDKGMLTRREKEILRQIEQGLPSKEIARNLSVSVNTISRHRQNILGKLRVGNSIEACRIAKELGLLRTGLNPVEG